MTALAADFPRERVVPCGPRVMWLKPQAALPVYRGSLMGHELGSNLAQVVDPANPSASLIIVGTSQNEDTIVTTASADGPTGAALDANGAFFSVVIEGGRRGQFDSDTGGDTITSENIGEIVYGRDSNTLSLTDKGGTISPVGPLYLVDPDDGTLTVNIPDDSVISYVLSETNATVTALEAALAAAGGAALVGITGGSTVQAKLAEVGATTLPTVATQADATHYGVSKLSVAPATAHTPIALGANDPKVPQSGTATLVAGVTAAIVATVTANTRIVATVKDPNTSALTGKLAVLSADRTIGAPGSFKITAILASGDTINVADISTVDWHAVG